MLILSSPSGAGKSTILKLILGLLKPDSGVIWVNGERVVGVDLVRTEDLGLGQVTLIAGDVSDPGVRAQVRDALGGPADLVISDLAPKLSGIAAADEEIGRAHV